jgi:MFS family permease
MMDEPGATSLRLRTSLVRRLLADRRLCRVELAFAGFNAAEYGVWVTVLVYAYQDGGTGGAAVVAVAQLLPAALFAPLASTLADARGGAVALRLGYLFQTAALASIATLLAVGAAPMLVYAAAIAAASAVTITRPAQAALLPVLVGGAERLTAANVLSGWVESVSVLIGPALAGALIAAGGPEAALSCFAVCTAAAAVLIGPVASRTVRPALDGGSDDRVRATAVSGGLDALRADRGLSALVLLLGAQYLVIGVLDVLVVVLAVSVVALGPPGAGYLSAAFASGGIFGALVTLSLVNRRRLAGPLIGAAVGWGLLLMALAAWPTTVGAFVLLAAAGSARSVLDISGRTLLLRVAPARIRGRVFGMLEGVSMFALAVGSILVPALASIGGPELVLVTAGLLLGAMALVPASLLRGADRIALTA